MKKRNRVFAVLLTLCLMLTLCACGSKAAAPSPTQTPTPTAAPTPEPAPEPTESPLAPYAGEYSFHCATFGSAYMDAVFAEYGAKAKELNETYFVAPDMMADYKITLAEDGTGYLYWGEDNQGPIDWWTLDGNALQFKAGVSEIGGTLADGYMTLLVDDGFTLCFAAPGARVPAVELISMDEYLDLLYGGETEPDYTGVYYCYALENGGYRIRLDDFAQSEDGSITLNEDGTATMLTGDVLNRFTWRIEDGRMVWYDENGMSSADVLIFEMLSDGVFTMQHSDQDIVSYYAKADADVSGIETISVEEYRAAVGQG